jgi:hypothetical protein
VDNSEYLRRFNNLVELTSAFYGNLHNQVIVDIATELQHPGIDFKDLNDAQQLFVQEAAKEQYLACSFICQSDRRRYGRLRKKL